jgi:hypothetical protein
VAFGGVTTIISSMPLCSSIGTAHFPIHKEGMRISYIRINKNFRENLQYLTFFHNPKGSNT